ncbi:hypothetical protein [Parafilimonas terrae]|uniref:Uncharacterized protein n=1 Tax=Parafilimonas terrae TaxID=1465490 RepID=A0A1I5VJ10_9BACT|nr:hypothetical protein [Parafilimonas terrae]SFQ07362.1 hypothetical protein SAMN05444277_10512 [Parafilimonas terrae]
MHRYLKTKHKTNTAPPGSTRAASLSSTNYTPPGDVGNLYEQLLAQGFTKQEIHSVIYKCIMHEIACKKAYQQLPLTGKIKYHIQNYSWQATRFCKRLTAKGLMLLKTQWAKKPKNPI